MFIIWRHLPPEEGLLAGGWEQARLCSRVRSFVCRSVRPFVSSFIRGNDDRGSWSPWLPWRGFDEGVWGIDAASSVASGGLRSLDQPLPAKASNKWGSPVAWLALLPTSWIYHVTRIGREFFLVFLGQHDLGYVHLVHFHGWPDVRMTSIKKCEFMFIIYMPSWSGCHLS